MHKILEMPERFCLILTKNLVGFKPKNGVFGQALTIKAPIAQFAGIKRPRIMTESNVFHVISFQEVNPREVNHTMEFSALTSGVINSVRLSSIVKITDGINFYSTDSLMPLTIVPLKNELYVTEGQKITLTANYTHTERLDKACFEIK